MRPAAEEQALVTKLKAAAPAAAAWAAENATLVDFIAVRGQLLLFLLFLVLLRICDMI